ncbi:MAG TPA: hypothetical protein V6D03_02070, partial [Candidatus Caenarcaniphilales bacterium]
MKRLGRWLGVISLLMSCLGFLSWTQPAIAADLSMQPVVVLAAKAPLSYETFRNRMDEKLASEYGQKIDLN